MTSKSAMSAGLVPADLGTLFERMLRRMPRLELVEIPVWKPRFVLRGLEALQVRV